MLPTVNALDFNELVRMNPSRRPSWQIYSSYCFKRDDFCVLCFLGSVVCVRTL